MTKRRRWSRFVLVAVVLALAWGLPAGFQAWRLHRAMGQAQAAITAGRWEAARRNLAALAVEHPGALGGAVDYWLGICEATTGHDEAALAAFARVPSEFRFTTAGVSLEARANLARGRLRAAETRLENALARAGPDLDRLLDQLALVYEMQARFDDVRGLLRARLKDAAEPWKILREIDNIDQGGHPYDGLRTALDQAGRRAPDDDRVWLGQARLAIAAGRWDDAVAWLGRCRAVVADAPVWRAWLDWARGAGRPAEARRALDQLGPSDLDPAERLAARAWIGFVQDDPHAERRVLERWLEVAPSSPRALDRMAAMAHQAGDPSAAAQLRRRKAEVDRAMEHYRALLWQGHPPVTTPDRLALARTAESAGFWAEARAVYALIDKTDPRCQPAGEGLARLDRAAAERSRAAAQHEDPHPDPQVTSHRGPPGEAPAAGPLIMPAFTDDAEAVGLHFTHNNGSSLLHQLPEQSSGGVALLDFNGDGWLDVYCVQGGPFPPGGAAFQAVESRGQESRAALGDRLFRNRGDGTFEDATESSGLAGLPGGYGHGVAVGDYDGDGDPDLFLTRWDGYALYRNNGDATFSDATAAAGLGGRRGWPTSAAFADLDGDGDLDLYVCHYVAWDAEDPRVCRNKSTGAYIICNPRESPAEVDRLFRNDGGRFTDVTAQSGLARIDHNGRGYGVIAADCDDDGLVDLYVANDLSANYLLRNRGGMQFEEVGALAGVAASSGGGYQAGMGVAAGDLDGDGRLDLAVTNFFGESTTFYRNLGGGLFADQTATIGLGVASRGLLGFGIAFFDANNDGRLDLVSANGHVNDLRPNYPYQMPAQLLLGTAQGRLIDVTNSAGAAWRVLRMGRGLAVGDLDNDGRQDVLILTHNQPLAYLHNRTPGQGGRSLRLRLEGRGSNRDAVGARVTVVAEGRRLVAWRTGGGSFQSSSDPRLHFGLGEATCVDSVEVTWPSGRVDRHQGLRADAGYLLREGRTRPEALTGFVR